MKFIRYFVAADQSDAIPLFFTVHSEKWNSALMVRVDQSARYSFFSLVYIEKSVILC